MIVVSCADCGRSVHSECLLLYADRALSGEKVAVELERVVREHRVPTSITVVNSKGARMHGQMDKANGDRQ